MKHLVFPGIPLGIIILHIAAPHSTANAIASAATAGCLILGAAAVLVYSLRSFVSRL